MCRSILYEKLTTVCVCVSARAAYTNVMEWSRNRQARYIQSEVEYMQDLIVGLPAGQ